MKKQDTPEGSIRHTPSPVEALLESLKTTMASPFDTTETAIASIEVTENDDILKTSSSDEEQVRFIDHRFLNAYVLYVTVVLYYVPHDD